jgi:hypothetical protein
LETGPKRVERREEPSHDFAGFHFGFVVEALALYRFRVRSGFGVDFTNVFCTTSTMLGR